MTTATATVPTPTPTSEPSRWRAARLVLAAVVIVALVVAAFLVGRATATTPDAKPTAPAAIRAVPAASSPVASDRCEPRRPC